MDEVMTDFQFKKLVQMILEIVKSCGSIDEAVKKIETLLDNKDEPQK